MNEFFQELVHTGVYKRSQGRISRQVTFAVLAVAFGLAAWRMKDSMVVARSPDWLPGWSAYAIPGLLLAVGMWASFRVVNMPRFADFLIAVEAEMNKVSWPSRMELVRSSLVVIFVIVFLAAVLFGFDAVWNAFFQHVLGIK